MFSLSDFLYDTGHTLGVTFTMADPKDRGTYYRWVIFYKYGVIL